MVVSSSSIKLVVLVHCLKKSPFGTLSLHVHESRDNLNVFLRKEGRSHA